MFHKECLTNSISKSIKNAIYMEWCPAHNCKERFPREMIEEYGENQDLEKHDVLKFLLDLNN